MRIAENLVLPLLSVLLKPAVRFAFGQSVSINRIIEALKNCCIDLASAELAKRGEKLTAHRVSLMTGIQRRDLTRRLKYDQIFSKKDERLISKVLGQWQHDKSFLDESGAPRALTFKGENSEFCALVRKVNKNYSPASLLMEMVREELVQKNADKVELLREKKEYLEVDEKNFNFLARNIDGLYATFEQNLGQPREKRNLYHRTEADNLYLENLLEVQEWLLQKGGELHKEVRAHLSDYDADFTPDPKRTPGGRVVFVTFSYREPTTS